MAERTPTITASLSANEDFHIVQWTGLLNTDTGAPVQMPGSTLRSVQVTGTFGSGSVAIHGSNDGTNYAALPDPGGTTIAISSAGIKAIGAVTRYIKPVVSGGGGTTSLVATLLVVKE
jgi:hypothetical protein